VPQLHAEVGAAGAVSMVVVGDSPASTLTIPLTPCQPGSALIGVHALSPRGDVAVVTSDGVIRVVQASQAALRAELQAWLASRGIADVRAPAAKASSARRLTWLEQPQRAIGVAVSGSEDDSAAGITLRLPHGAASPTIPAHLAAVVRVVQGTSKTVPAAPSGAVAGPATKPPPPMSGPKHGQVDAKNERHSGGGMWAGGSGGSNTAGLGGRGGPYRLDSGHAVSQVSEADKAAVPADVLAAARAMAQAGLARRLEELGMRSGDVAKYGAIVEKVSSGSRGAVEWCR